LNRLKNRCRFKEATIYFAEQTQITIGLIEFLFEEERNFVRRILGFIKKFDEFEKRI